MVRVRVKVPDEHMPRDSQPSATHPAAENPVNAPVSRSMFTFRNLIIGLAILIGLSYIANLISDKNRLEEQVKGSKTSGQQVDDIVMQLSSGIELPVGETPQMRTIEDASKFTEQNPSLSDIKNGDVLLFFEKSQKVVVYRPSTKKAVVVVTLSQPTTDTTQQNTSQ